MTPGAPPGAPSSVGRVGPLTRVFDTLAGLFAAGILVVGVGLLLAQLLAPAVLSAAGWGIATGPGWGPVSAQLIVGVTGEVLVRYRSRLGPPVRVGADLAVIVAAMAVIAWTWWP